MGTTESKSAAFEKVGECLYRYSSNGVYYARFESRGKEIRRSLGTTDKATARRKLGDLQRDLARVDLTAGKCSLADLCDRYMATVQHQKLKTVERKAAIAARIKADFPGGADMSITKVVASKVQAWLSSYPFGAPSYNLHLEFVRAVFEMAVKDRLIPDSPIEHLKGKKLTDPKRRTPTLEQFRAIVADIRAQPFNADAKDSADFVEFMGLAGLGQAELAALTWGDFDFENEQAAAIRIKTGKGFNLPIYPQLRPLIARLHTERGGNPPHDQPLFKQKEARKALANACKRLGLPNYSSRAFRRMFITRAIQLGVDVQVVAKWQGHRDGGKLILSTYSHVASDHSANMAKLISEEEQ